MKSPAPMTPALHCGTEGTAIHPDDRNNRSPEMTHYGISDATRRNWKKLNTSANGRLAARANKRKSDRRVLPLEYVSNKNNIARIEAILDYIDDHSLDIMSVMLTFGTGLLKKAGILMERHVALTLDEYKDTGITEELVSAELPDDEFDILGLLYQSYLLEGMKNITGSYYTPQKIARSMVQDLDFSNGQTFLDPCCGSGAFLLAVSAKNPQQIYGIDNDKTAVLIAKINMLLKYKDTAFVPQIYCSDYLSAQSPVQNNDIYERKFNYIATNPPWGAMNKNYASISGITSKESFSYFFVKSFNQLNKDGTIKFLFPEAVLNVKNHKDIRKFILDTAGLVSITIYEDYFSGVSTKYVDIECGKNASRNSFYVSSGSQKREIDINTVYQTDNLVFNLMSDTDMTIIKTVKEQGRYSLKNSTWALGIVTGDNKNKLHSVKLPHTEKIHTGKEIQPYVLLPAKKYIHYNRSELQQAARDEIYRAPEKLVYKFISSKLVFAYDNNGRLFLNSANILIPDIPLMNIKSVLAFLNSTLFQFMYIKLFGEVKVLKGNLIELLLPEITHEDNHKLTVLADAVLNGDHTSREHIDNYIFSLYGLTEEQKTHIMASVK